MSFMCVHNLVMITHNYIMHSAYTQVADSLVNLAHNPRRAHMYYAYMMHAHSRRDLLDTYSRDRMH